MLLGCASTAGDRVTRLFERPSAAPKDPDATHTQTQTQTHMYVVLITARLAAALGAHAVPKFRDYGPPNSTTQHSVLIR